MVEGYSLLKFVRALGIDRGSYSKCIESFLETDPSLLGVLNYQQRNLEQSRTYLESSLKIKPSLDATIYLSFVAEATHDNALFADCQKKLLTNIRNFN